MYFPELIFQKKVYACGVNEIETKNPKPSSSALDFILNRIIKLVPLYLKSFLMLSLLLLSVPLFYFNFYLCYLLPRNLSTIVTPLSIVFFIMFSFSPSRRNWDFFMILSHVARKCSVVLFLM